MASGKLLLRISELRHLLLQSDARDQGVSVNELCRSRVESPSALESLPLEVGLAVRAAQATVGEALIGIILFGSYARGSQTDGSDIDLLVVVDQNTKINRTLYRTWQSNAEGLNKCEPHFVSLLDPDERISGLWAEVAIDGQILWDRQQRIHQLLVKVRRSIIEGKLIAKKIHGQTYWVHSGVA